MPRLKILIVEDEQKTAAYLMKGLGEEGFSVDHVADGDEGLSLARERDYDLLILDIMLPGRDGWSLLRELRRSGVKTLALLLTARDAVDDRVRGLDLGADAYLVKPFAFSELMATIRSLLRRGPQRAAQAIVEIGDLVIDTLKHTAHRGGQRLELTPKEFALLLLLARRKGEILSRTLISEQVWNIHFDSGSNSVDVHIRRLRAKVDDPWPKKLIRTIRGVGYMLEVEE
jgi:two-component system copper resistance phosphate regulon response regulator CusR